MYKGSTPRAIIYDLDGTIIDSRPIVVNILKKVAEEFGFEEVNIDFIGGALSRGGNNLISSVFGISIKDSRAPLNRFREVYASTIISEACLYSGVAHILKELVTLGIRLCICTNKPRNLARTSLEHTQLAHLFEFMVAGDDLHTKKPRSENVECCLSSFGLSSNSVFYVGDSLIDQKAATSAGVRFCFFSGGYDDGVDRMSAYYTFNHHDDFRQWYFRLLLEEKIHRPVFAQKN